MIVFDNVSIDIDLLKVLDDLKLETGKLDEIRQVGEDIRVTCPCHAGGHEEHPSANIYIGKSTDTLKNGTWHCFTCNSKGSFVNFVSKTLEVSEEGAKEWLKHKYYDLVKIDAIPIELKKIELSNPTKSYNLKIDDSDYQSFHPYMIKRHLKQDICEKFNVKYDPLTKSLVFPVYDINNELVFETRRSVNTKEFYIPRGVEKPLYLLNEALKINPPFVIITEGQIDALTSWSYGVPAIATMGAISQNQIDILNSVGLHCLVTMFDNDNAGKRFRNTIIKKVRKDMFLINIDIKNNKKDINDLSETEFNNYLNEQGLTYRLMS